MPMPKPDDKPRTVILTAGVDPGVWAVEYPHHTAVRVVRPEMEVTVNVPHGRAKSPGSAMPPGQGVKAGPATPGPGERSACTACPSPEATRSGDSG